LDAQEPLKRVVVVGCCGAGKTTFSRELARRLHVPYVERDGLGELGSETYRAAAAAVVEAEAWVFDGPPYYVEPLVYSAAQVVAWLDYTKPLVVGRAVRRSLGRTFGLPKPGEKAWGRLRQWIAPGGPYWAWTVYARRQREFAALADRSDLARATVLRFGRPQQAHAWLESLPDCS
jgi:hypothetical protein